MGGWQEWIKVQAALDDREWDFRTVTASRGKPDWPRTPWYGCSANIDPSFDRSSCETDESATR